MSYLFIMTYVIGEPVHSIDFCSKVQGTIIGWQVLGPVSSDEIVVSSEPEQLSWRVYRKVDLSRESTSVFQDTGKFYYYSISL